MNPDDGIPEITVGMLLDAIAIDTNTTLLRFSVAEMERIIDSVKEAGKTRDVEKLKPLIERCRVMESELSRWNIGAGKRHSPDLVSLELEFRTFRGELQKIVDQPKEDDSGESWKNID